MPEVILLVLMQLSEVVQRHVIQGAHIITHFRISSNMSEFQRWDAINNRNTNIPDKHLMEMKIMHCGRSCVRKAKVILVSSWKRQSSFA